MKIDHEFADRIIETSLRLGADEVEVFGVNAGNLTVEVKKGEVDSLEKSVDAGYSVRVIKDGKQGFSYSTDLTGYKKCIEKALETAKWSEEDKYIGLPKDTTENSVNIFDPDIDSLDEERGKELALTVEEAALREDRRIAKTRKTSVNMSSGDVLIANSHGIVKSFRSTAINSHIMVVAEDENDSQTGWDYQGGRFMEDVIFPDIGRTAARRAIQLLGAQKGETEKAFVILDNSVASEFLSIFASALSAESVQKGKSLLAGKIGKRVVSEKIDIVDNALIDRLVGSRPFDGEGVSTRNKSPIEKGVLTGYLHNTYTANKDNTGSTGNAVRGGFKTIPSVGITNMFISPPGGTDPQPFDSLVSSVDNGLLVTEAMGVHMANPISGDLSVGVTGIWIKDGKLSHPVKEIVVSGNILDIFMNIVDCGNDLKFFGKIGSPSLLMKDIDISG